MTDEQTFGIDILLLAAVKVWLKTTFSQRDSLRKHNSLNFATASAEGAGYFQRRAVSAGTTGAAHCENTGSAHQGGGVNAAKTNDTLAVCPSKRRVKHI